MIPTLSSKIASALMMCVKTQPHGNSHWFGYRTESEGGVSSVGCWGTIWQVSSQPVWNDLEENQEI